DILDIDQILVHYWLPLQSNSTQVLILAILDFDPRIDDHPNDQRGLRGHLAKFPLDLLNRGSFSERCLLHYSSLSSTRIRLRVTEVSAPYFLKCASQRFPQLA